MAGKSGEDVSVGGTDGNDVFMDHEKLFGDIPEPVKPPGPYVLFFRDTVTNITKQNPNVEFDEIKKIVESIWNSLSAEHKLSYENKHQMAKLEYQQDMISYLKAQQNQLLQVTNDNKTEQNQIATKPAVFNVNPTPSTSSNTGLPNFPEEKSPTNTEMAAMSADASSDLAIDAAATVQPSNANASNAAEGSSSDSNARKCLRLGCNNTAVENADWEDEYCNNECVVMHCRTVFNNWVQTNKTS